MVVLLPDGGRGYLGKIFNDRWMRSYGFSRADEDRTVADLVAHQGRPRCPTSCTRTRATPSATRST